MLRTKIQSLLTKALKEKDKTSLLSLRYIWAQIKNAEIDKKKHLSSEEITSLIQKEVKSRNDAIADFKKAKRQDLVSQEETKLKILTSLLPKQMQVSQIEAIVNQTINDGNTKFGQIMRQVISKTKGKADGSTIAKIVKEKLSNS